jgi:hypothetical protein
MQSSIPATQKNKGMQDGLLSGKTGRVLAEVWIEQDEQNSNAYTGQITAHNFPPGLLASLQEYKQLVNDGVFSLLDALEEKIKQAYDLRLLSSHARIKQLFVDGKKISFTIQPG